MSLTCHGRVGNAVAEWPAFPAEGAHRAAHPTRWNSTRYNSVPSAIGPAWAARCRRQPRQERQLAEIVQLAVDGNTDRASGLIAEHLAELPADQLIGRVQAWMSCRRSGL
jgi:hypothetical protein